MKYSRRDSQNLQTPLVSEGNHFSKVVKYKKGKPANTIYGETPTILVTFQLDDGQTVMQSLLLTSGSESLVEKLIDATIGEDVEEIDFDDLIDCRCGIEVKHNHYNGKTYASVVDIFPSSELEGEAEDQDQENEEGLPF